MDRSEKYLILPILYRYWLRRNAVAIHMHKKEHKERTSNERVNDSGNGMPAKSTTR
jgi:hypothetical protein